MNELATDNWQQAKHDDLIANCILLIAYLLPALSGPDKHNLISLT